MKTKYYLYSFFLIFTLSIILPLENNAQNEKQVLTQEQMLTLLKVSEPRISPDGKWVLFTLTSPDIKTNKSPKQLIAVSIDGKKEIKVTDEAYSASNGVWSPNGKMIAFLSKKSGNSQIYIVNFTELIQQIDTKNEAGRENKSRKEIAPVRITNFDGDIENLLWSPDGSHFSFTSNIKVGELPAEKYSYLTFAKVMIFDKIPIRHWDEWLDGKYSHLFIMAIKDEQIKKRMKRNQGSDESFKDIVYTDIMPNEKYDTPVKPFGDIHDIAWSPDGKEIAYTSKKVENYAESTNSDVFVYTLADGKTKDITEGLPGIDGSPLYSPDGKWLAFHSMKRAGFESDRNRLMLYNRFTGAISELSKSLDQWVGNTVWSPDNKSVYFSAEDKATVQLYQMQVTDGSWKIITTGCYNYDGGLSISNDGSFLVVGRRNMLRPTEIFSLNLKSNKHDLNQLTDVNGKTYENLKIPSIREKWITSTDGKKVQCWVIYPPDFDSTKSYPMLTYCQGGPQSTVSQFFSYRWNFQLMASNGYIVLAPNRRGLPGFGQAWNDAISKDWGGLPMQDILAATDAMLKLPYIDRKRVAAVGASAGGYAVFWLEGNHNKKFCAFVSHCGVFNLESEYGATEELWFPNWENGGPYWDKDARHYYDKNSPHRYAQNWDTPILIITGENDFRVPYTQSLEAFTVAQVKGIPSKLIIFPEENHWILSIQNALVWQKEFFSFLDKYCKH